MFTIQDVEKWCCNNLLKETAPSGENCTWVLDNFNSDRINCGLVEKPKSDGVLPFIHYTIYKDHLVLQLNKECKEIVSANNYSRYFYCSLEELEHWIKDCDWLKPIDFESKTCIKLNEGIKNG